MYRLVRLIREQIYIPVIEFYFAVFGYRLVILLWRQWISLGNSITCDHSQSSCHYGDRINCSRLRPLDSMYYELFSYLEVYQCLTSIRLGLIQNLSLLPIKVLKYIHNHISSIWCMKHVHICLYRTAFANSCYISRNSIQILWNN